MTPRDLRNIHNTRNSCRDTLQCANMALKLPRYIYLLMDAPWSLLTSLISLLSGGTVQLENTYSCILKVRIQVWASQKRRGINTNHSYHQRSNCRFSFNQPNRKTWGAKLVHIKNLPHKAFL